MSADEIPSASVTVKPIYAVANRDMLERLAADVASGAIKVPIERTYTLDETLTALKDFTKGTLGKLVIQLQ